VGIYCIRKLFHDSGCWVQYIPGLLPLGVETTDLAGPAGSEGIADVNFEDVSEALQMGNRVGYAGRFHRVALLVEKFCVEFLATKPME